MPRKKPTKRSSKKTTKKSAKAAKKTSRKRSSTKQSAKTKAARSNTSASQKKVLICVNDERCFWTNDGRILSSLTDLRDAFDEMEQEVYRHHVSGGKNDFADWVQKVLHERTLARSLRRSRKPSTARTLIVRQLKTYDL